MICSRAVVAALLTPLVLTACGSKTSTAEDEEQEYEPLSQDALIEAMADAVAEQRTVRFEVEAASQTFSMAMRMGAADELAMSGTMDLLGESVEILVVDGEAYLREDGDTTYQRFPQATADMMLAALGDMSPQATAEQLTEGMEWLDYVGVDEIDGETLYEYEVTLGRDYLAKELREKAGGEEIPPTVLSELPTTYGLWLDDDELMRRLEVEAAGEQAVIKVSDWGGPVKVEAPAPSQVEELELGEHEF